MRGLSRFIVDRFGGSHSVARWCRRWRGVAAECGPWPGERPWERTRNTINSRGLAFFAFLFLFLLTGSSNDSPQREPQQGGPVEVNSGPRKKKKIMAAPSSFVVSDPSEHSTDHSRYGGTFFGSLFHLIPSTFSRKTDAHGPRHPSSVPVAVLYIYNN